jgi:anti-sigma factor ChrR (cupin superfamily)
MSPAADTSACDQAERLAAYALGALPANEVSAFAAHLAGCSRCREELDALRALVDGFSAWPADVLRPPAGLWGRLAQSIAAETGGAPVLPRAQWIEPEWEEVVPGISCKLLATDHENARVSMLVRLAPGVAYPPHTHAGVEELHLLDGELWIDDRKLHPGDYNRGEPGASDQRVWSETGCTCILITSPRDVLRPPARSDG